jgi:hypothetical protein
LVTMRASSSACATGDFAFFAATRFRATAELWLPVAEEDASAVDTAVVASPPQPPRPLIVLAVDDDALVLANTRAMLEDLGHVVLAAYRAGKRSNSSSTPTRSTW